MVLERRNLRVTHLLKLKAQSLAPNSDSILLLSEGEAADGHISASDNSVRVKEGKGEKPVICKKRREGERGTVSGAAFFPSLTLNVLDRPVMTPTLTLHLLEQQPLPQVSSQLYITSWPQT